STQSASMAALLRIGELKLRELSLPTYNKNGFTAALSEIRTLVETQPYNFPIMLRAICAKVGVAVIFSGNLQGSISGVTRWIGKIPLIQMSDSHKTNDLFWLAFYQQAGHIVLHGKKDVFIADKQSGKYNSEKDNEAIEFAANWLLPGKFLDEIPHEITIEIVQRIAKKYTTHPAIVISRLQYLNLVSDQFGSKEKVQIDLGSFI
ncbi:MAG: ImmA/IrrE family metallo-endopeptidase, partial [Sphingobacterium sp.]